MRGTIARGLTIGADAAVVVRGTVKGGTVVRGSLVVKGTVYDELSVEEGGRCVLEGAVYGQVVNHGTLRADVDLLGDGSIRDEGAGEQRPHQGDFTRERDEDGALIHTWRS